ncbi:MAG: hypothetical protein COB37_10395 [Kordiimonadales bacterium]|nr:MAG: hypothetical protein COB37_10395 [Kordiimonadales bacterium]
MTFDAEIFNASDKELRSLLLRTDPKVADLQSKELAGRFIALLKLARLEEARTALDAIRLRTTEYEEIQIAELAWVLLLSGQADWARDLILPYLAKGTTDIMLLCSGSFVAAQLSDMKILKLVVDQIPGTIDRSHPRIRGLITGAIRLKQYDKALNLARQNYALNRTAETFSLLLRCLDAQDRTADKVDLLRQAINSGSQINRNDYHNIRATHTLLGEHQTRAEENAAVLKREQKKPRGQPIRIALCLSGQMRNFEACAQSVITNLTEKYDTDIFISTWDRRGFKTSGFQSIKRFLPDEFEHKFPYRYLGEPFPGLFPTAVAHLRKIERNSLQVEDVKRTYPTAELLISSEEDFEAQYWGKKAHLVAPTSAHLNQLKMYYGLFKANEMKTAAETRRSKEYDLVIRARPDCLFPAFDIHGPHYYETQIIVDKLFLLGCGDQIAISTSQNMDKYAAVWQSALSILDGTFDDRFFSKNTKLHPHRFMAEHLHMTGLSVSNSSFPSEDIISDFRPELKVIAGLMLQDMVGWRSHSAEDRILMDALKNAVDGRARK